MRYKIRPREGYTVAHLTVEGATLDNAYISCLDENGCEVCRLPLTDVVVSILEADIEEETFEYVTSEGLIRRISVSWDDEGFLRGGCNPFKQLIYRVVKSKGGATEEEVFDALCRVYRVCRDDGENRKAISELIAEMRRDGQLNLVGGVLKLGGVSLPVNDVKVPFERGFNPIMKRMEEFVALMGSVNVERLRAHLVSELSWCTPTEFEGYFEYMVENGHLRVVNGREVLLGMPLEPY